MTDPLAERSGEAKQPAPPAAESPQKNEVEELALDLAEEWNDPLEDGR